MHEIVELSIPYNLVNASGVMLGFDAFFWNKLSSLYRRVLLIRSARELSRKPIGCKLNPEVDVEYQVRSLIEIASLTEYPGRSGRSIPLSLLRLASLIIPYRIAEKAWESMVNAMFLDEVELAKFMARRLLELGSFNPLKEVWWLNVRFRGGIAEDRVISHLLKVDKTFSTSLTEVIKTCTSTSSSPKTSESLSCSREVWQVTSALATL